MTQSTYPITQTQSDVINTLREIERLREQEDIPDFTNLPNRFVAGRSTTRVPASPLDVLATDNLGDIVIDTAGTFEYKLIDAGGTATWERRALNTSW